MLVLCSCYSRIRCVLARAVIVALIFALMGCGDSSDTSTPPTPTPTPAYGAGAATATEILKALASGAISFVGNKSMGWIFSLLKSGDSDETDFNYMKGQLQDIIDDLEAISNQLTDLFDQLNIDKHELENLMTTLAVVDPVDKITNNYENINGIPKSAVGTAEGKSMAATYAKAILNADGDDIDQCQYDLYMGIVGDAELEVEGILSTYTDVLIAKESVPFDGQELTRYESLETMFKNLLEIQLKAATLMCEALHWQQDPWVPPSTVDTANSARVARFKPTVYSGTAADWMKKFQGQLDDEVQEFLRCTDRIVLSEADLRTDLSTNSPEVKNFLPSNADVIYARADFLAAQISSTHHFGLNVRLIGEPDEIQDLVKNYGVAQLTLYDHSTRNLTQVPLSDPQGPANGVNLNPVEQWWNWPTDAAEYYAQWNWGAPPFPPQNYGHIKFNPANQVAVAKYESQNPILTAETFVRTSYPYEGAKGSPDIQHYDDNMNVVAAGTEGAHEFGHVILAIRHRPDENCWFQNVAESYDPLGYYDVTTDAGVPAELWCRAAGKLSKDSLTNDNYFSAKSGIAVTMINGSDSQQTLSVTGSLETDATNTCTYYNPYKAQVGFFFDQDISGAYKWWDIKIGSEHAYDSATVSYDVSPEGLARFTIMVDVEVGTTGGKGDEYSVKAYPQKNSNLYLFF